MATTYLALLNGVATGAPLPAADWNKFTGAVDRQAALQYALWGSGRLTGWGITSGTSCVASGTGQVGGCYCVTTVSQAISGLASGTMYVFAKTDAGSPASGTIDFVARTTSGTVTNADGVTAAVILGKGTYVPASGFTSVDATLLDEWGIDHGGLNGLTDDDHPQYMQDVQVSLYGGDAITPATSAASTSTFGSNFPATVVKFPALSGTKAGWPLYVPPAYSGTVTLYTDWVSSGLSGAVRLRVLSRAHSSGETWDSAPASTLAAATRTIGGSNGQMMRLSHTWSTGYSAGERATLVLVRDGDNSSDVMSGTARLLSARVVFPTAQ